MKKKLLIFMFLVLCTGNACAQNDTFTSVDEILGKEVRLFGGDLKEYTYVMLNDKLKLARKVKDRNYNVHFRSYKVDPEPYVHKKDKYIVLRDGGDAFYFKEEEAAVFLHLLKNETFWNNFVSDLNNTYTYLDIDAGGQYHSSSADVCYDKLSRLRWTCFLML